MNNYTSLEQSKILAEILPIDSADMCLNISQWHKNMPPLMTPYSRFKEFFSMETPYFLIPCWSLAALLDVLPYPTLAQHANELWSLTAWIEKVEPYSVEECDNKIDACYEMILKLHDQKLL